MLAPTLLRRLTTIAKQNVPELAPLCILPKQESRAILNIDPIQATKDAEQEYRRYKLANYETKVRVNHFLQAVFANDILRATQMAQKFREKCSAPREKEAYARNVEVYYSCMSTLLAHVSSKGKYVANGPAILALMAQLGSIPILLADDNRTETDSLYVMFVSVLLRAVAETPASQKRTLALILAQTKHFTKSYKLDNTVVYDYIRKHNPDLIPSFNAVWKENKEVQTEEKSLFDMAKYRNSDGLISFAGICDFLRAELFDTSKYDPSGQKRYHEIYEALGTEEKAMFMAELSSFNKQKQLVVEAHCTDLQTSSKAGVPSMLPPNVLQWVETVKARIFQEIDAILLGKAPDEPMSRAIIQHSFLFEQLSKETLVSVMLNTLIRETTRDSRPSWVLQLTKQMSYWLKNEIRTNPTLKAVLVQLVDEDEAIQLFAALVKLAVEKAQIDSEELRSLIGPQDRHFKDKPGNLFVFAYENFSKYSPAYAKGGMIQAHPYFAVQTAATSELFETGLCLFPMLCEPKPWTTPKSGGFLNDMAPLVRTEDLDLTYKYLTQAHLTGQLNSTYESLNALGKTAWMVESEMADVLDKAMRIPDGYLNIPPTLEKIKEKPGPEIPNEADFDNDRELYLARGKYHTEKRKLKLENANARSQRIFYNMTANLAKALAKHGDMVYYPATMDFRSRVYPAVSLLSYQGEDLVRSLLVFWEAKPLGKHGFGWLKYQLANLYSKQFMSMEELEKFVAENENSIRASAEAPFDQTWWTEGDHPWQVLQLSKEITKIWNFNGNTENWMCRIPIHMDGTCNGLQHYAALGANVEAARSVNLVPSETKSDVYLAVLKLVKQRVEKDRESSDPEIASRAKESSGFLTRKLIKQTVMTTVYGVTRFGAFRQINEKLSAAVEEQSVTMTADRESELLLYVAKCVLEAVGELFGEARSIQRFLMQNTFRCISSFDKRLLSHYPAVDFFDTKRRKPMMWTTLSGFPVIQNYRKDNIKYIQTVLQILLLRKSSSNSPVDVRKQMNAVAPNFIHSLDAIHLMMTNLAAQSSNIAFATVHDSFWTHPCDVEVLSTLIREQFVRLHSSDVLLNFYKDIEHLSRNDLQLVWVEKSTHREFVQALEKVRPASEKRQKMNDWLNVCLNEELKDNTRVDELVAQYDPQLILQIKSTHEGVIYDHECEQKQHSQLLRVSTHVPILVPLRLSKVPPTGDLDIKVVLESKFFFS